MNHHLSDQHLIGYICRTLSDNQRESMDRHLIDCRECRARLADHESVQRHIHHSLLTNLRPIRPPARLTFDAIAQRARHPDLLIVVSRRAKQALVNVMALGALGTLTVILIIFFSAAQQPSQLAMSVSQVPTLTLVFKNDANSEGLVIMGNADLLTGWRLAGDQPQFYDTAIDDAMIYRDEASIFLRSRDVTHSGYGALIKTILAERYRGKRLRLSGYLKSDSVDSWAGLWMRIDGPGDPPSNLGFDNMQDRSLRGTTEWSRAEIVLDIPQDGVGISFGVVLAGKGQVWMNHLQLEIVDQDMPTTNSRSIPR